MVINTTIGKAFKLKSGEALSAKNMKEGRHAVYGGNGISGYHNEFTFEEPKIVIGRVGAYCGNVHLTKAKSWITDNALYIDEKYFEVDDKYLLQLLRNLNLNKYASQSGQPLISAGRIKDVEIPLPPLATQQKIAAILDAADELRQKDKALVAKYDELTQALFLDMFGDPKDNQKNFKRSEIGKVIDIIGGSQPAKKFFKSEMTKGYIRLVQIRDYKSDRFLTYVAKNSTKKFCTKDDIMIGRYGPPVFQILRGIDGAYNVALMKATPGKELNHEYVFQLLSCKYIQEIIIANSQRTAGQTGVNLKLLNSIEISVPPIKLQNQFADRVKAIEEQKSIAQASALKSEELFNSLLQKAFNGELE